MATTTSIDLQAGRYHGDDLPASKAFSEVQTNWTRLKNTLTSGGLPALMVKITSAYSSGYDWVEVYEVSAGTFAVLSGGRASGVGGWPKAFEANGGTADFTNAITEVMPSTDITTSATTVSFDGKAVRVAANDLKTIPSAPSFAAGVLTIPYSTFSFDIKGKSTGAASSSYTVAITGTGGVDCKNNGVVAQTAATFINLPATNLSNSIFEFIANLTGADLQLKSGAADRNVLQWSTSAGGAVWDFCRMHP